MNNTVSFMYLNHRGEWKQRTVIVDAVEFYFDPMYDYQPGWFLSGFDVDKQSRRSFALSRIKIDKITNRQIFRLPLTEIKAP